MQEAIPYKSWLPLRPITQPLPNLNKNLSSHPNLTHSFARAKLLNLLDLTELVRENAIIVFSRRGCCMSHVVKRLLQGLGVNPPVQEIDEDDEDRVVKELEKLAVAEATVVVFPAVFIGGRFFGGLDKIMATHITGELTPVLKEAGALWL